MKSPVLLLWFIIASALLVAAPVAAQVFKCKGPNGGVVYQDGPCEGAAVVDARPSSGVSGGKGANTQTGSGAGAVSTKPTHPVLPEKMRR